jgi:hypothetical protein
MNQIEALTECTANFDPLLNNDMCRMILINEARSRKKNSDHDAEFVPVGHDLDEFEQALI